MSDRLAKLQAFYDENPKDTFILFALAKEYETSGDLEKAMKFYQNLKSEDAEYIGLYFHLGKLYEKIENLDEARSTYQDGLEIAKKHNDFHAASELNGALEMIKL